MAMIGRGRATFGVTVDGQGEPGERGSSQSDSNDDESSTESSITPKSRKRVRKPQRWKKNTRIRLRNSGKSKHLLLARRNILVTTYFTYYCHIKV